MTRGRAVAIAPLIALLSLLLVPAPVTAAAPIYGNGDTRGSFAGTVVATKVAYECGEPTVTSDPDCNNFPVRFEVTDDFTTVYVDLTTDAVRALDLDLFLYTADGTRLGSSARPGSDERAVIRIDEPITADAVLVVQPYVATAGVPFTLDVRVKTSKAVPDPIVGTASA